MHHSIKYFVLFLIINTLTLANSTKILVHYMPWYQAPPISSYWGWHWTMNHFDPEVFQSDSSREIASQYYPLTGPYDSRDIDLLEYQVLLMKLSGVDGVIVDWYGIEDYADYGILHESTQQLFYYIQDAELEFSICYEDRTIENMVNNGYFNTTEALNHGKMVMNYLNNNWFNKDCYVKIDNRPLLLSWGPIYFKSNSDWMTLFSDLETKPHLFTLDSKKFDLATGAYPWPPMHLSKNGELNPVDLNLYLAQFYQKSLSYPFKVATAFPGFYDIYEQAGLHDSYGYLPANDGATFLNTLTMAMNYNPEILQIATWNDYGEGTIIEPTKEFGYQYLLQIQELKRTKIDSNFSYGEEELHLPFLIYQLRKKNEYNYDVHDKLDDAFEYIINGEIENAKEIISALMPLDIHEEVYYSASYIVGDAYPNPFNPATNFKIQLKENSYIDIRIYDIKGNIIKETLNINFNQGVNTFQWHTDNISSGIYFVRFMNNQFDKIQKVVLLK